MGLVNTVRFLEDLEEETLSWCRQMLRHSPLALRCLKASLNADCDGQMGLLDLAGNATLLYYMSEEAKEGKNAFVEKRVLRIFPNSPDFRNLPHLRTMTPSSDNEGAPRNGTAGQAICAICRNMKTSWNIFTIRKIRAPGKNPFVKKRLSP